MTPTMRKHVLDLMKQHKTMTIATVRGDGYPQATTVTYANDGLVIYFGCGRTAQKVSNIKRSSKVSLTIDRDYRDWSKIKGLSMAANAQVLKDRTEIQHAMAVLAKKFPQWAELSAEDRRAIRFIKACLRYPGLCQRLWPHRSGVGLNTD